MHFKRGNTHPSTETTFTSRTALTPGWFWDGSVCPVVKPPPPADAKEVLLLGVPYTHIRTQDGGDLYLTRFGIRFWEHLLPRNWFAPEWFQANRERLIGTSTVYKVPTRTIRNRSLHLVVKWSRVGEDVPVDTVTINQFINAEFNSPFEEFSLLSELRAGGNRSAGTRIRTQMPLAIYVPSERLKLWQTGRSEGRIAAKIARHPGVEIDILRQYVLLYGWVKGLDLTEVADLWELQGPERQALLTQGMQYAVNELESKGYRVVDMKPQHVIVRPREKGRLRTDRNGRMVYAVVDYELMERTPEHEDAVRGSHRRHYLEHMARRFDDTGETVLPPHLQAVNILGVDYIHGQAESTGGKLWVVGRDPDLFSYFLPERWRRTRKERLAAVNDVFYTRTKDNINMVWRVSRMGDEAVMDGSPERNRAARDHGYNSPFEEFAWALDLDARGVGVVSPRAIYSTGDTAGQGRLIADSSRFHKFAHLVGASGEPIISRNHEYVTLWRHWVGPSKLLLHSPPGAYRALDLRRACREGRLSEEEVERLLDAFRLTMAKAGFEHIELKADHLLVCVGPDDRLVMAPNGLPEMRLCNFELVRHLRSGP